MTEISAMCICWTRIQQRIWYSILQGSETDMKIILSLSPEINQKSHRRFLAKNWFRSTTRWHLCKKDHMKMSKRYVMPMDSTESQAAMRSN